MLVTLLVLPPDSSAEITLNNFRLVPNKIDGAGKDGDKFTDNGKQCVGFVQKSRPDIKSTLGSIGNAKNIIEKADKAGFARNNVPRAGAIIVMPKITNIGHVGMVSEVKGGEGGIYTIKVRDANAANEITKNASFSLVREREFLYDSNKQIVKELGNSPLYKKEQTDITFIHEQKTIYDEKEKIAKNYIITETKRILNRELSDSEKQQYAHQLMSGVLTPQDFTGFLRNSPEGKERVAKLQAVIREESIKAQKEASKSLTKCIFEETVNTVKTKYNDAKNFINTYVGVPRAEANVSTNNDATKLSNRTVGSVNKLDNVPPQLINASIISKSNDMLTFSYRFSEPMMSPANLSTDGYCAGVGCTATTTESWSKDRKTYTTIFSVSTTVSPSGNIVNYTINDSNNGPWEFKDLAGNPAPTRSGSFTLE